MTLVPNRRSIPTEKQYAYLLSLGGGSAIIVGGQRETEMYLRRGWVTAEFRKDNARPYYAWIRITPEGVRALAAGMEKYGLPWIGPKPQKWESYCGDCDSKRIYQRLVDVDVLVPA